MTDTDHVFDEATYGPKNPTHDIADLQRRVEVLESRNARLQWFERDVRERLDELEAESKARRLTRDRDNALTLEKCKKLDRSVLEHTVMEALGIMRDAQEALKKATCRG